MSITVDEDILIVNDNIQVDTINENTTNVGVTIENVLIKDGSVTINSTTASNSTTDGALVVSGGVGIAKEVHIGETLEVVGTSLLTDTLTLGNYSFPTIAGSLGQILSMSTSNTLIFSTPASSPTAVLAPTQFGTDNRLIRSLGTDRDVDVTGITISDNDDIDNVNSLAITGTGVSNDTTTGALTVCGGVGIKGDLNVGGDISFDGTLNGDISSGSPGMPSTTFLGEGDSYTDTMVVLSNSNLEVGSWVDNTTAAASDSGSTFSIFQGTGVNNACYIGSDFTFLGVMLTITTSLVASEGLNLIYQYWNGSAWTAFTHMTTQTIAPYDSYARLGLEETGDLEMRIGLKGSEFGLKTLDGNSKYWIRFYVGTSITTVPIFEQIRIHTNRLQVNINGFIEYYGLSRSVIELPWGIGLLQPFGSNSPDDADLFVSDNLGVGAVENLFSASVRDIVGFHTVLPGNMDTSYPLKFDIKYMIPNTGTGDVDFTVRWGYTSNGDAIYTSGAGRPITGPNEQSINKQITMTSLSKNTQYDEVFVLDISDLNTRKIGSDKDILWVTMERDGSAIADTFGKTFAIVQIAASYVKWCEGGYATDYVTN